MQMIVSNQITIVNPDDKCIEWCKENLVIPNPDYTRKERMGLYIGKTPRKLELYKVNGNKMEIPFGCLKRIFTEFPEALPIKMFKPYKSVDLGDNIPLYPYQQTAVKKMYEARYGILQSPAGSGKTQMGLALIQKYGRKALWLTHTKDLLDQSYDRAKQYIPEKLLGKITEGKIHIGDGITFATVQTMARIDLTEYKHEWDVIVVDECHRLAGTPTAITQFYRVMSNLSARHKYGISATVHRADGTIRSTFAIIGDVEYRVDENEVADKIMQVAIRTVQTGTHITEECLNGDGTINFAKLINHFCEDKERNELILGKIIENQGQSSLILSDRVKHLQILADMLPPDMKKDAVVIDGKMTNKKDKELRKQGLEDMRSGKKKYLFATWKLAKEGLDIPRMNRLYMVTPQKDYAVITQAVGRIARSFEGKEKPIAYDFVDQSQFSARGYRERVRTYKKIGCEMID